jgi:hypothetical protein
MMAWIVMAGERDARRTGRQRQWPESHVVVDEDEVTASKE